MNGRLAFITDVPDAGCIRLFCSEPDILSVPQVAKLLGVATATVRREVARGNLEAFHVGRAVRITKAALLKYVGEVESGD